MGSGKGRHWFSHQLYCCNSLLVVSTKVAGHFWEVQKALCYVCRPEINVRDTAFKRGTAYLERYCLLIAFTSFLERTKGSDITFQASPRE